MGPVILNRRSFLYTSVVRNKSGLVTKTYQKKRHPFSIFNKISVLRHYRTFGTSFAHSRNGGAAMIQKDSATIKKDYSYWIKVNQFSQRLYGSILVVEILGFALALLFMLTFILEP